MIFLLDTHILLWWLAGCSKISAKQADVIKAASPQEPLYVSDMTLWEIATLYSLNRITISEPINQWFNRLLDRTYLTLVRMSPEIATDLANLPDSFHRDPADRTIVSTARVLSATLLTADRQIINSNLVKTL